MVAHNADFDMSFIAQQLREAWDLPVNLQLLDTVALASILLPQLNRFKLDTVGEGA